MSLHTEGDLDYDAAQFSVTQRTSLVFSVQACAHASMALSELPGMRDVNAYQVILGADTGLPASTLELWRDKTRVRALTVPQIVQCNVRKMMWVSWRGDSIQIGKGPLVGNNLLLTWQDPQPISISVVALARNMNHPAEWIFEELTGA